MDIKAELYCLSKIRTCRNSVHSNSYNGNWITFGDLEIIFYGIMSKNSDSFAKDILEMYKNDQLWNEIRSNYTSYLEDCKIRGIKQHKNSLR